MEAGPIIDGITLLMYAGVFIFGRSLSLRDRFALALAGVIFLVIVRLIFTDENLELYGLLALGTIAFFLIDPRKDDKED